MSHTTLQSFPPIRFAETRYTVSMSSSSLIPEHPLVFFPSLAATLGLEESILLQLLHQLASNRGTGASADGFHWVTVAKIGRAHV